MQQYWPSPNPTKDWKASYRSHGLSQPSQCSHQLSSQGGSGIVTSRSRSKSVTERWNIWFQVMERLSAALFFFPTSLPDYSQLNLNGEQFHRWNKYEARLHATLLPLLHWLSDFFFFNSPVLTDDKCANPGSMRLAGRHHSCWMRACPNAKRTRGLRVKCQLFSCLRKTSLHREHGWHATSA